MSWRVSTVGIVGGGTMGAGIAICVVRAGLNVVLHDLDDERTAAGRNRVLSFLDRSVDKGKLSVEDRDAAAARLTTTSSLADMARCEVVVEAVFEDVDAKRELFGELDDVIAPDALMATNTSTLSVSQIAAGSRLPERVVGTHFCNPAPLMSLVEVVKALQTNDVTFQRALDFVEALDKTSVRVKDTPGFFLNRFLVPYENDCIRALAAGVASVEDIDRAITMGLGHPMGPFTLLDTVGLDIHHAVSLSLYEQLKDPRFAPPPLVDQMIAAGHLGRKTGRGFYDYADTGMFGT